MSKIEVKNVYKIFGDQPSKVLPMVRDGATKEEVLEKTGHTVGLDNVSLSIEEGEIVERGDHEDLISRRGRYHELYTIQARI